MVTTSTMTTAIATALVAMLTMTPAANAADPAGYKCAGTSGYFTTIVRFHRDSSGKLFGDFLKAPSSRPMTFSSTGEPLMDETGMRPFPNTPVKETGSRLTFEVWMFKYTATFTNSGTKPELTANSVTKPSFGFGSTSFTIPCGPSSIGTAAR